MMILVYKFNWIFNGNDVFGMFFVDVVYYSGYGSGFIGIGGFCY